MNKRLKENLKEFTTNSRVYKIITTIDDDPYWDECITFYPKWRPGFKNSGKPLMAFQIRMYKSWKHNRKTQWKEKK